MDQKNNSCPETCSLQTLLVFLSSNTSSAKNPSEDGKQIIVVSGRSLVHIHKRRNKHPCCNDVADTYPRAFWPSCLFSHCGQTEISLCRKIVKPRSKNNRSQISSIYQIRGSVHLFQPSPCAKVWLSPSMATREHLVV